MNELPPLRIGCGAGFSGDRWDSAIAVVKTLAATPGPAVLMFEMLAERTLALAQLQRRGNPEAGWEPSLERFIRPVLADCVKGCIPIVGNFGAANPRGAAALLQRLAQELGLGALRIAVVEGDDLLTDLSAAQRDAVLGSATAGRTLVSANAYLGAQEIAQALKAGAQIVVTGRVADPALVLGPLIAHFGWRDDDWDRLARGTMAGHLLECGAQVTGGYFADPGIKDVPDIAAIGFPIVEVSEDGTLTITKADGTGGCVDTRTVTEQLLYEIHDPRAYLTPDVVADIGEATLEVVGRDRVRVRGVRGHARPPTLKATVCYEGGWLAEGEISYAGPNAAARARMAGDIVQQRLKTLGVPLLGLRRDVIGVTSVFAEDAGGWWDDAAPSPAQDVRLRVAVVTIGRADAEAAAREVLALYTCGPAGGGGVRTTLTPRLASDSCYVPREWLRPRWSFVP
ncbi:acyclic terpene utilization AtuA family protein [Ramlibacter sp.]|uniref:acyclic terpene utilization AtuA family protein n=1 Tax=Ramlibacter sp. TaxID=1917967 RepID=UPI003D14BD79